MCGGCSAGYLRVVTWMTEPIIPHYVADRKATGPGREIGVGLGEGYYMMLRYDTGRWDGRRRRYVSERARDLFVAASPAAVGCVDDLVAAASNLTGYSIEVVESDVLGNRVQGKIVRSVNQIVTIAISDACLSRDFTLAYEIGHLVMGHRLGPCDEIEVSTKMRGIYKHSHETSQEREAEYFARCVTWMLEVGCGASTERQWRWLYQLSG